MVAESEQRGAAYKAQIVRAAGLVMALFAVMASTTTCLIVRLGSDSDLLVFDTPDTATIFLPLFGWVLVFCSVLFFISNLLFRRGAA